MKKRVAAVLWGLTFSCAGQAGGPLPLFDAHLHYNVEAAGGPYPLDAVLKLFRDHRITGILANSRPNDGTRALYETKPKDVWVVPFIRPYIVQPDRYSWFKDPKIFALIETEHRRGYYQGIGEFHLFGEDARSEWVRKAVDFAVQHDLYLHAHSDEAAVDILFAHNPQAKIVWAHTGFHTAPERIEQYLKKYPRLWGELSYRYDVTEGGKLKPAWRRLFEQYPDRFVVGSDTWVNERWDQYGVIMNGYRDWLAELPRDVAEMIAWRNAERLFRK